jgi:hypothetical protein
VYDGAWRVFRNSQTIHQGAVTALDPAKVDSLRLNARDLLEHYPQTVPALERLGIRIRALLNRPVETYEDILAWAESIFNQGPIAQAPTHVADTMALAYDDVVIEVKAGKYHPVYVLPSAPRGAGVMATVDFSRPGSKTRYGPRHAYTKMAFAKQTPHKTPRYQGTDGQPRRPRGRPRNDGLMPGSPAAIRANQRKQQEREARRQARLHRKL